MIKGTSLWEMISDAVSKMDLGYAMLLAALVSMVYQEHLTFVIIGASFREKILSTVSLMNFGEAVIIAGLVSIADHEQL